jgi:hypothetical protein
MVQFSSDDDSRETLDSDLPRSLASGASLDSRRGEFTLQSANQMLPLVERIVRDMISVAQDLSEQDAQIRGLERLPKPTNLPAFTDELTAMKESFQTDRQRLESCQRELDSLGVKVESLADGVIDFPASINRRPVMLCWKLGEPRVAYWHLPEEGFQKRREVGEELLGAMEPPSVINRP